MNAEKWDWKKVKPPDSAVTSSGIAHQSPSQSHHSVMEHSGHTLTPYDLSTKSSTSIGKIFCRHIS